MEKSENQRIKLTKRLLKESLLKLLDEKNIKKISVSELCQTAGINRSTFYKHYGSQFDVLKDMELDMIEDLENIYEKERGSEWTLQKRAAEFCKYLKDNQKFIKLIMSNSDTDSEFASLLIGAAHVQRIYQQVFPNEKNRQKHDLMTTFLTGGTYAMTRKWLLEDIPITPEEMGELMYNLSVCEWDFDNPVL
ncbi:MAG: TetR/AcrR family transcriptional regulator [Oscillospiraceae bacterium]